MRRGDKQVAELADILSVIDECTVCRVALFDDEFPYIIPLSFGYAENEGRITLYFHCALEGKKLDLMQKSNKVGFEMDCSVSIELGTKACGSRMSYKSICGTGTMSFVKDGEKLGGLRAIMDHYQSKGPIVFDAGSVEKTAVLALEVSSITGKRSVLSEPI